MRKAKALKQKDLGKHVGLSDDSISKMELGQRAPSVEALLAIANYFGVSIDYLVGRTDDRRLRQLPNKNTKE